MIFIGNSINLLKEKNLGGRALWGKVGMWEVISVKVV